MSSADPGKYNYTPRLFHLSASSGVFEGQEKLYSARVTEGIMAMPFLQENLYSAQQPGADTLFTVIRINSARIVMKAPDLWKATQPLCWICNNPTLKAALPGPFTPAFCFLSFVHAG